MGFLDKQSRVVDFVLTERGRRLYAAGQLDFSYYALFDDGVDYDPYVSGSTLTHDERELQIESLPMLEAPFIHEVRGAEAPGEPRSHLFTAAPGYGAVPHMRSPADGDTLGLTSDQRQAKGMFHRFNSSKAQIRMVMEGETEAGDPGYIVRVFSSGAAGLTEVDPRRDLTGRRAYDPFLAVVTDADPVDPVVAARSAADATKLGGR